MTLASFAPGPRDALLVADTVESASAVDVRMEIHDASRLEWSVSIPLPEKGACAYSIAVEMAIPSNAFARHSPWDQLQSFTRLDGGDVFKIDRHLVTIDALRRGAVAVANQMGRLGEVFTRHCTVGASLFSRVTSRDLETLLGDLVEGGVALAAKARAHMVESPGRDPLELARERLLVDEYVSIRLLAFLAGAERSLTILAESRGLHAKDVEPMIPALESRIADALEAELQYRAGRGYVCADPGLHSTLEAYIDRASRLKKHFQEVLFLDAEIFQVAERLHHWAAAAAALVASTFAFSWQIALMQKTSAGPASRLGSGIVILALVAGIGYVVKDRLKEIGREWLRGNVHRFYAQRVARYRAPARRVPSRDVMVTARESFEQELVQKPDPLNPESGSRVPSTLIRYTQRGKVLPVAGLAHEDVKRVKHVFRYDLSPLFARLDDAVKQIPVLDRSTHRVRFTEAPRSYRFPIRLTVTCDGRTSEEAAIVVLHKGGLDRLERVEEG